MIKHIEHAQTLHLAQLVEYQPGRIVSQTLANNPGVSLTLFAFGEGEGLSEHTAPGDALVQALDGAAVVTIGTETFHISAGEAIVLPANIPHALAVSKQFKMLLTIVKPMT